MPDPSPPSAPRLDSKPTPPAGQCESNDASAIRSGLDGLLGPINGALEKACDFGPGCPQRLGDAIRYAVLAPGKRLRPALTLMAGQACGAEIDAVMPGAVAVEMIHAYSLIHDDLPAMDDDDLRRGRPTVHVAFDQATAILAGDALQVEAFAHLGQQISDPQRCREAVRVLSRAAGAARLVGGQADDLAAERGQLDAQASDSDPSRRTLEHLESIHRRKTGALFAASLDLGAILAGADTASRQALSDYAGDLGLAFQVVDDLLDLTTTTDSLGKRTGKDADRGKLTYPGLLGIDAAREKAKQLVESAKHHVDVFGDAAWRLTWLADYVLEREH
ncbi:MAG: polyprenyl synthetase family protein [Pirellulales bacterium]|nr:polyprenyl synthetase family protein [Pirellulales bacterium]